MKIEITNEEYVDLLDLLHIANWVLVSHKTQVDPLVEKLEMIIQKFYALAREMGRGDLVEYDPGRGKYHPTKALEDTSRSLEFIDEFVDHSFWDELIVRFAERDAARQAGGYEKLDLLGHEERHAFVDPFEERYAEEFNERGIERLEIVEHFGHDASTPVATHD
jgi:hypothetical protein